MLQRDRSLVVLGLLPRSIILHYNSTNNQSHVVPLRRPYPVMFGLEVLELTL